MHRLILSKADPDETPLSRMAINGLNSVAINVCEKLRYKIVKFDYDFYRYAKKKTIVYVGQ